MNLLYFQYRINKNKFITVFMAVLLFLASAEVKGQYTSIPPYSTTTIPAGSYYIDMGITPQTVANGLKPYGLLYQLLLLKVPVIWSIDNAKAKDGIDIPSVPIVPSGTKILKGGPFIILAQYRTAAVNTLITTWQGLGVVGYTSSAPVLNVPVYVSSLNQPNWTLDEQNGGIAVDFFKNAGIPPAAHGGASSSGWKLPSELMQCDDIFVMPHADPKWLTHRNLLNWNDLYRGSIWLGCHSGSAQENMFDNLGTLIDGDAIDFNEQTNFLAEKTGPATGAGPYSTSPGNTILLWGSHSDGTVPYSYDFHSDPVMQFMGTIDAATQNGSEQIYIPLGAGWRSSTKVGVYDPDHTQRYTLSNLPKYRAAVLAYGPGMGDPTNGNVMMEASHDINGTAPANIAAQRAFFNFSLLATYLRAVEPTLNGLPANVVSGQTYSLSFSLPAGTNPLLYTAVWSSSCGGTFTPTGPNTVDFIPPAFNTPTICNISVTVTDNCGRVTFDTKSTTAQCDVSATPTVTNPCFNTPNAGVISFTSATPGPYSYTWARTGGGSGSGSGNNITGLSAGTYTVTATTGNGCAATFTSTLTLSTQIVPTATPGLILCNGGTTSINTTVTGGIPAYSYLWSPGGATTQNRSGLTIGTYNLTVTDSKGCIGTTSATITQPTLLAATATPTHVNCNGASTGSIVLSVTGGTGTKTFLWNDGTVTQDRTAIPAGSYTVVVTDANGCTASASTTLTQPATGLALSKTQVNVNCNGGNNGSVDLSVSGGTSPYSYSWNNGATTQDITNLTAGTYLVTVTDSKGCNGLLAATITQPLLLTLSTVNTRPSCPPGGTPFVGPGYDGAINLTVSGGTGPYSYAWTASNGGLIQSSPNQAILEDLTLLRAGTYTVIVTDSKGCTATISVTLTNINPNPVQPTIINH